MPAYTAWNDLMRKLRGLAKSTDRRVSGVGQETEGLMKTLMAAIYAARVDPPPERVACLLGSPYQAAAPTV
ncbi:hypothetical protein ACCAA_1410004 [Candidatus Accumulibacter aalborgensis]|uniref:Transposase n=1 Tax=Candidatus Accumulibacter aalborgensis TaxID=1860102 RepID=A0A1A8XKI7_9PROT|nr:hypothetical protein ACCAA_1410004 [Candidatus Accumulibacter aalborgensis]